jgi:hypothetical protein
MSEELVAILDGRETGRVVRDEMVLDRWARKFQVSARNAFGSSLALARTAPERSSSCGPSGLRHPRTAISRHRMA